MQAPRPRSPALSLVIVAVVLGAPACSSSVTADDTAASPLDDGGHVRADVTVQEASVDGDAMPDAPAARSNDAPLDSDPRSTACDVSDLSTLPHVHIVFRSPTCVFTVAQAQAGVTIPYDVVVDQDVPDFTSDPAWYPYTSDDVANLALTAVLSGGTQRYCLCDKGLPLPSCPVGDGGYIAEFTSGAADGCAPVTIPQGTYSKTFSWDGHNWNGPSDTSAPEGPLFPPGDYELVVSNAPGTVGDGGPVQAIGKMVVHLLP